MALEIATPCCCAAPPPSLPHPTRARSRRPPRRGRLHCHHQLNIKRMWLQAITNVAQLVGIIVFGALIMLWLEADWSFNTALYWAVETVTTIGYGDLVPTRTTTKWFFVFYALAGTVIFAQVVAHTSCHFLWFLMSSLWAREWMWDHRSAVQIRQKRKDPRSRAVALASPSRTLRICRCSTTNSTCRSACSTSLTRGSRRRCSSTSSPRTARSESCAQRAVTPRL